MLTKKRATGDGPASLTDKLSPDSLKLAEIGIKSIRSKRPLNRRDWMLNSEQSRVGLKF